MRKCAADNMENDSICKKEDCKLWIKYGEDLNCTLVSVKKHGRLTLQQVGKRMGVSHVRIKQIKDKALKKLKKCSKL